MPLPPSNPLAPDSWLAWSQGAVTPFPRELSVPQVFEAWVEKTPDAPAVLDGETRWSYRELDERANGIANGLQERGIAPGALVGIPAVRSAPFIAAVLGVLKMGGVYVPFDLDEPAERQARLRQDCTLVLDFDDLPQATPGTRALSSPPAATAPAYVLYTSGSTGEPKGVVVPHRAIIRLVCETDYIALQPGDVIALHSDLCFDASTLEIWGALLNGAALAVTTKETVLSPPALAAHLRACGITTLWLTTSLFNQLVCEAPGLFAGLRHLIFGGEAADAAAVRRVLASGRPAHLINGYGPTETTTFAVCQRIESLADDERVAIGRPIANTNAFVLDAELQPATEGELHIGGDGLAISYLNNPQLTAERFIETPWGRLYKTGDLVRWRADGTLDYLGRLDRQLKIRGFRIEPGEIEAVLGRHPAVRQSAIIPHAAASGEPMLAAYFVGEAEPAALREFLRGKLPAHMIPLSFTRVEALALTPNGKLDLRALPPPVVEQPDLRLGYVAPQTEPEQRIARVWQEVLGLASAGIDDNFFDLGGTSLLALRVHARLGREFARDVPIAALFQYPTIRTLARHLEAPPVAPQFDAARERAVKQRAALAQRRLLSKR